MELSFFNLRSSSFLPKLIFIQILNLSYFCRRSLYQELFQSNRVESLKLSQRKGAHCELS